MNVEEFLLKGGVVVWILIFYSILGLAIVLERYLVLLRMGTPRRTLPSFPLDANDLNKLRGPEKIVLTAMDEAQHNGLDPIQVGTRIRNEAIQRMETGFSTIAILANTAPLLGLLGTIMGMIKAFMVIEMAGGRVDAQALAGGMWEAMLTTGAGLSVSIPLLILLHFLEGLAEHRAYAMQRCIDLVQEQNRPKHIALKQDKVHHWEEMTNENI